MAALCVPWGPVLCSESCASQWVREPSQLEASVIHSGPLLAAGPVPTANVEDVVHLAKGLMRRVQNHALQLMDL